MPHARKGWTIVETLVAMAMVTTLLGIALPVLSHSLNTSRTIECVATIRSYAQATHAYASDARDFPPNAPIVEPGDGIVWTDSVFPVVQLPTPRSGRGLIGYPYQGWFSIYMLVEGAYLPPQGGFCPSQPGLDSVNDASSLQPEESSRPNYAIPEVFYLRPNVYRPDGLSFDERSALRIQRLTDVRQPSEKVMIFEYRVWHARGEPKLIPALISGGSGSVAAADGSARDWRLNGTLSVGENTLWNYEYPSPWITEDGILGSDLR
jgi:competence protein ComGC